MYSIKKSGDKNTMLLRPNIKEDLRIQIRICLSHLSFSASHFYDLIINFIIKHYLSMHLIL